MDMVVLTQCHVDDHLVEVTRCHSSQKACTPRTSLFILVLHVHLCTLCHVRSCTLLTFLNSACKDTTRVYTAHKSISLEIEFVNTWSDC